MCHQDNKQATIKLIVFLVFIGAISASPVKRAIEEIRVLANEGETVTLLCHSNDEDHNFLYWHLNERNIIIGPSNDYDIGKFRYEVLSGNLTIRTISKNEEGIYDCVSRGIRNDNVNIRPIRMIVEQDWEVLYETNANVNLFRVIVALCSLIIICGVAYIGYKIWKNRFKHPSYLTASEDEAESDDELFRTPGTSRNAQNSSTVNLTNGFETPGISTDFKSILDTANSK